MTNNPPVSVVSANPITRKERAEALIYELGVLLNNELATIGLAHRYEAALLASEAHNRELELLLHQSCKMLATLSDEMPKHAEDRHEIEEFQARARAALSQEKRGE